MEPTKHLTIHETLTKLVSDNERLFISALQQAGTGSFLIPLPSTDGTKGVGESLPVVEQFSEANAPTVIIVVRATPESHNNVAALLARYRGDDPKAGTPKPRKGWFS